MEHIDMNKPKPTNRAAEKTLGIIGSALGIHWGINWISDYNYRLETRH
ncbi:hypothetical protein [Staphylococcus haemolyticus]|nr:hypothetical protein [Staphylococcus haemolyticus]MDU0448006.1 hypothetical protein [Staphylococcus haemolyticus]